MILEQIAYIAIVISTIVIFVAELLYHRFGLKKFECRVELVAKYLTVTLFILLVMTIIFKEVG